MANKITITLTHLGKLSPKDKRTREALECVRDLAEDAILIKLRDFQWMPRWIGMKSRISLRKGAR